MIIRELAIRLLFIRERGGDGAPANFSGCRGGDTLHEINLLGTFIFSQQLAAMFDQGRFGGVIRFVQDYRRSYFFTQGGMYTAKRNRRRDCRMPQ